jgi:DNA-directed RNA polymerase subunit RPC12/RpoP
MSIRTLFHCSTCSKPFELSPSEIAEGRGRHCSWECRYPARSAAEVILDKLDKTETCWIWKGAISHSGYGLVTLRGEKSSRVHRRLWIALHGPIPEGKLILHRCDVRACCRPDHLFLGTHEDNMSDMVKKKRQAVGSRSGVSKLSERDVLAIRKSSESCRRALARFAYVGFGLTSKRSPSASQRQEWPRQIQQHSLHLASIRAE